MCGRFALEATSEELARHFHLLQTMTAIEPRYNIAPSQQVAIIRDKIGGYRLSMLRWGLIPHWSKDEKTGAKLINARSETISEKPSFREAFKLRRCLIPASGFYEWTHDGELKRPYFIRMKNSSVFAMAGIWETWRNPADGKVIETCAIITTEANGVVGKIHNRMPVIIPLESIGLWLASANNGHHFREYFQPYSPFKMTSYPVSGMVNNPRNEGIGCIKKVTAY